MDYKKILKNLERKGFKLIPSGGSRFKLMPPQKDLPFYSLHSGSDKLIHPLRRFAAREWNLDIFEK